MSVGEIDVFVEKYKPLLFPTFKAYYPYCYRCPIDKKYQSCKIACIKKFEEILENHYQEIAACIIEPIVQGAAGMIVSPSGFLKRVRQLCTRYNILLIADEVATGFGRTGKMFACEHEDVTPDFLCLAKGITGGYLPLAATLTTDKIYKAFLGEYKELKQFFHGHTYTGNPLGCAAAIANLKIVKKEKMLQKLKPKITLLSKFLANFKDLPHVGDVRQKGLIAGIELVKDKKTKEPYLMEQRIGRKVCMEARKYGLIIRPLGNVIVIMPPLSITAAEIKNMMDIIYRCIKSVTGNEGN
jgi:adenosylmethionine-8-amino-7-oxononanoate aminotransferase